MSRRLSDRDADAGEHADAEAGADAGAASATPGRGSGAEPHARIDRIDRIDRGDIYWVAPDADRGPGPAHPHVVVQDDVFNHSRVATVIVCALTTNLQRATEPGNVLLDEGEGGLPKRSVVVVSQVSSLDRARLGAYVGALSRERVEEILAGLRFQQASFFAR